MVIFDFPALIGKNGEATRPGGSSFENLSSNFTV
jgi:hypothetical protein